MPQRPNKPCRHRGCGTLTRDASSYCEEHRAEAVGWARSNASSAAERGYGGEWRKIRARVMRRDVGLCQPCARLGAVSLAQEVDHIVNKAQAKGLGWTQQRVDAEENLQAICKACHKSKTAREARRQFSPPPGWPPPRSL